MFSNVRSCTFRPVSSENMDQLVHQHWGKKSIKDPTELAKKHFIYIYNIYMQQRLRTDYAGLFESARYDF